MRGLWWYDPRDDGLDPREREHHFGLTSHDYAPKPAYVALVDVRRWFQDAHFESRIGTDPNVYLLKFRRDSGTVLYVWWTCGGTAAEVELETVSAVRPSPATLRELGIGEFTRAWRQDGAKWRLALPVKTVPRVIECGPTPVRATSRLLE